MKQPARLTSVTVALASSLLGACGGGGGGGSGGGNSGGSQTTGLETPTTMSVVTAQNTNSSRAAGLRALFNPLPGAGTDYTNEHQDVYVHDESMESLKTVNMILCLLKQTRAADLVNQGAYIALVNESKCEQGQNQSGGANQSAGAGAAELNRWTVLSTRADNSSPQYVKFWVPGKSGGADDSNIVVEATVNEGVSAASPFGSFVLNYRGAVDASLLGGTPGTEVTTTKGTLQTDNTGATPAFQFAEVEGNALGGVMAGVPRGGQRLAHVILNDGTGSSGTAKTVAQYNETRNSVTYSANLTHGLAFNATLMAGNKQGTENTGSGDVPVSGDRCLSRTNFHEEAWQYNLYSAATGARVNINSGFPFTYNGKYGNVGYFGLWYEDQLNPIPDGATVAKQDFRNQTSANYRIAYSPGRLIKRTRNIAPIASLSGMEFTWWGTPGTNPSGNYRVVLNAGVFQATDSVAYGNNGPTYTPITPVNITPATNGQLYLWSEALGGQAIFIGGSPDLTFYQQEFVTPATASIPATLHCYSRCLKGGLDQPTIDAAVGVSSTASLFYADITGPNGTPYNYAVDTSVPGKIVVRDPGGLSVDLSSLNLSTAGTIGMGWGGSTGEMITGTVTNPWDVYGQAVSYRWETGPNPWNRLVTAQDLTTNAFENFVKPLQFKYVLETGDDRNGNTADVGKTFLLQYGGAGQLWGFPHTQDSGGRWHTSVTLKDGVILNDGSTNYIVKALNLEQSMKPAGANAADLTPCTTAALATAPALSLPLLDPANIGAVATTWADRPNVTSAPAVIEGALQ